ncbi:MAG: carbon-nitrogen hydrolase family protein, partial [Rubrivivax sp.]
MKVAALQMVSGPDVAANLGAARRLLEDAARRGAQLAALPEYFCLMGMHDSDKLALAETEGEGPIQAMLASAARDLGLWIIGGTLPIKSTTTERVRNSTLVFSPN